MKELREALKEKEDREQKLTAALEEKEEELKELRQVHFISVTFCTQTHKRFQGSHILYILYMFICIAQYVASKLEYRVSMVSLFALLEGNVASCNLHGAHLYSCIPDRLLSPI